MAVLLIWPRNSWWGVSLQRWLLIGPVSALTAAWCILAVLLWGRVAVAVLSWVTGCFGVSMNTGGTAGRAGI